MSTRPSHVADERRKAQALKKYSKNLDGKLVRKSAFRECDYTPEGHLWEFDTEDAVQAFEKARYEDGTGHNCKFWKKPKDTVPQKQLALDKSLKHAIKEEGNEIKVQVEQAAEGLHERFDETQQLVRELKELVVGKGKKAAAETSKKVAFLPCHDC